jgi:hypothetical protein
MASIVTLKQEVSVRSVDGLELNHPPTIVRWAPGAGTNGKRETVTLAASAFTALSPPSGAKAVVLILGTATGLTLKGVTGDTGIVLVPSSNPLGFDAILPLGTSPSIGITSSNTASQTIEVIWL